MGTVGQGVVPIQQHGAQAGLAGGVEFGFHVGEKQNLVAGQADRLADAPVAGGFFLAAAGGVEETTEQRRQAF